MSDDLLDALESASDSQPSDEADYEGPARSELITQMAAKLSPEQIQKLSPTQQQLVCSSWRQHTNPNVKLTYHSSLYPVVSGSYRSVPALEREQMMWGATEHHHLHPSEEHVAVSNGTLTPLGEAVAYRLISEDPTEKIIARERLQIRERRIAEIIRARQERAEELRTARGDAREIRALLGDLDVGFTQVGVYGKNRSESLSVVEVYEDGIDGSEQSNRPANQLRVAFSVGELARVARAAYERGRRSRDERSG